MFKNAIKKFIIKKFLTKFKDADYEIEEAVYEKQWGGLAMIEKPKEGGILTYIKGCEYPFRGLLDKDIVNSVRVYKKILPMVVNQGWDSLHRYMKKPNDYCQPAREIYRIMSIMADREGIWQLAERWRKIRDVICVIIEFDDAYRFRFQDAISEINPKEFNLTDEDKYWCEPKPYNFRGRDEWVKQRKQKKANDEKYDKDMRQEVDNKLKQNS